MGMLSGNNSSWKVTLTGQFQMKQLDDLLHVCDVTINQLQKDLSNLEQATALEDKES